MAGEHDPMIEEIERWSGDVVLSDGGTVHVRPIEPADAGRLAALHGRLSSESIYYRFFSPKPRLSDKELEKFTTVDMHDRVALVATLGDEIIGVGRYDRWPGKDEAEVAFTVDDVHHGRGVATMLLEHLAAVARTRGIGRFTAEVLPDNRPMLGVFRKAGFEVTNEFASGIIDVAFDIDPTDRYLETVESRERRADARSIARIVRPRTVAVIGASERVGSVGAAVYQGLVAGGFDGPVYPVNPTLSHVGSSYAFDSVVDIPDDVHLAVVAVPASEVRGVVEQCAQRKVRGIVVISTGFGEGGGEALVAERELVELARGNGMRLIGPASMGMISTPWSLHASLSSVPVLPGRVSVSLQSGPLGIAMLELAHRLGVGLSTFVSLGNKADVSANDFLNYWDDDPDTDVVLLYTESFGNPRKFGRIARRVSRRKPIVAVKAGRSGGDDVAADALYQQAGVIRVETVRDLFDTGRVLVSQPLPAGPRVAVVSNASSPATLALDGLVYNGLRPAVLAGDARRELMARLPAQAHLGDAIDLTYRAVPVDYRHALEAVLGDSGVDSVLVIYAPPLLDGLDVVAATITEVAAAHSKPVIAVTLGHDDGPLAPGSPVPAFAFPEAACKALRRITRYAVWRARPVGVVPSFDDLDVEVARSIVATALKVRPGGTLLPLSVSAELLRTYGIDFAPAHAVTSLQAAVAAAEDLGYPVALKAAGLARLARSESGGVALDLQDAEEVAGAYGRMRDALGVAMAEAVVQVMVPGGVETIVDVEAHPAFGPVVSFGLGGAFADAIADRTFCGVPLADADASRLVASSKAWEPLAAAGADLGALEELLARVGLLVDDLPEIQSLRLNPVIASRGRACAVDVKIVVAAAASPDAGFDEGIRRLG